MSDNDRTDLADILDRDRAPEPAPSPAPQADSGVSRDDHGRFAPRAEKPMAEAPAPGPTGEPIVTAPPAATPSQPPEGYVPLAALIDNRMEARQAKQQAEALRRELEELRRPKADPVDFYADPDAAFNQRIQQALTPYQQNLQSVQAALLEERLHRIAGERAPQIEQALTKAMDEGDPEVMRLAVAVNTQGVRAVNELVAWYDRKTFDPSAKEAEIEARILAKYGIASGQEPQAPPPQPQKPAPVMPSNLAGARNVGARTGPQWSGPSPISDIFDRKRKPA
jgi:hypothetical protein